MTFENYPKSAADWQLFTHTMKCTRAGNGLTTAIKKSFKVFDRALGKGKTLLDSLTEARESFEVAQAKYINFGAYDTEPSTEAHCALVGYAEHKLGEKLYISRFDY